MISAQAKAIRDCPSGKSLPTAAANVIDAEFSDNAGRAARMLHSPVAWKRTRFKEIAHKAAKVMEDRYIDAITQARNHRTLSVPASP